jgi:class 3 adenylate cyclase
MQRHGDAMRDELHLANGKEIDHPRNGLLAVFQRPTQALQCVTAIRERIEKSGCRVRAAIHIGECDKRGDDFSGLAIQLISRILDHAKAGEILASRTVRDLVAHAGLTFEEKGEVESNSIAGTLQLFSVGRPDI